MVYLLIVMMVELGFKMTTFEGSMEERVAVKFSEFSLVLLSLMVDMFTHWMSTPGLNVRNVAVSS